MITATCVQEKNPWTDRPYEGLKQGENYEVRHIEMGSAMTFVFLKGIKHPVNSVCLQFSEDGKTLDIFNDKRFNPYL